MCTENLQPVLAALLAPKKETNPLAGVIDGTPRDTGYKASTPAPITGKRG